MRAMFEDARQQVLDNKVFRLLLILTGIPILFTFLIGFREDAVVILWGLGEYSYSEILEGFGGVNIGTEEVNILFIQFFQGLFINVFAGSLGMMLCIAATAFFAPRLLEKGAADTVFSKPVSRTSVLMSRYLAGILFVAFISTLLVVGMYLGFLIVSGYSDPGFLWGAVTLVYLFAMMHAFSIAVAVWTRSSTAAILLTIILFMICGAVHEGWIGYQFIKQQEIVTELRSGDSDHGEEGEEEEESTAINTLLNTLSVMHYALPKTSDADRITNKLRRAITEKGPDLETADGDFLVKQGPVDFRLLEETRENLETTGVIWVSDSQGGAADGQVTIRRYERPEISKTILSKTRTRLQTSKEASKDFMEELESKGETATSTDQSLSNVRMLSIAWDPVDGLTRNERMFLAFNDHMYVIEIVDAKHPSAEHGRNSHDEQDSAESGSTEQDSLTDFRKRRRFLGNGNIVLGQVAGMNPEAWYESVFGWDSELKYNIYFSISTSLAFIFLMLGLAGWKLRRIDF